jgi:hypothetical protein
VLSDGEGIPWWSLNGSTGVESVRQVGYNTIVPVMKVSGFGYGLSSYRAIVVGGQTLSGTFNTVCIGYDPSANPSGSYSGSGIEVFFQNGVVFSQPNSTNTSFNPIMQFSSSGYGFKSKQSIGVGDADPTSSGAGIVFPATQSASSNANTLDDYEEGNCTLGITFGGGNTGITYVAPYNSGTYTRIGRQVTVTGILFLSNKGSSTGNAAITGLPFTTISGNGGYSGAALVFEAITSSGTLMGRTQPGVQEIEITQIAAITGTYSTVTNANFTNDTQIRFTLVYTAA